VRKEITMSVADFREVYRHTVMFNKDSSGKEEADVIDLNSIKDIEKKNVGMKISMAGELRTMGLSGESISRVLNVALCDLETPSTTER
jgi:hypothetical protein